MERLLELRKTQKIFFVIAGLFQNHPEPMAQGINKREMLGRIKDSLLIYVLSKSQMSPLHEFSILISENPQKLTSNVDEVRKQISSLDTIPDQVNVLNIFKYIETLIPAPINEAYPNTIQIIYITSQTPLNLFIGEPYLKHPDIFIDFIYFNDKNLNEGTVKQISSELNQNIPNKSFMFIINSKFSLCRAISLLTAHPQQRQPQSEIDLILSLT